MNSSFIWRICELSSLALDCFHMLWNAILQAQQEGVFSPSTSFNPFLCLLTLSVYSLVCFHRALWGTQARTRSMWIMWHRSTMKTLTPQPLSQQVSQAWSCSQGSIVSVLYLHRWGASAKQRLLVVVSSSFSSQRRIWVLFHELKERCSVSVTQRIWTLTDPKCCGAKDQKNHRSSSTHHFPLLFLSQAM